MREATARQAVGTAAPEHFPSARHALRLSARYRRRSRRLDTAHACAHVDAMPASTREMRLSARLGGQPILSLRVERLAKAGQEPMSIF